MEFIQDEPWGYNEILAHDGPGLPLGHGNIYIPSGPGWPTNHQPPTPPVNSPRELAQPILPHTPPTPNVELASRQVTDPKGTQLNDCVKLFKDWHARKGNFRSQECPEESLTMKIGIQDFQRLKTLLCIEDEMYVAYLPPVDKYLQKAGSFPKYFFDAGSSTLTIQRMPSPLHEQVVATVAAGFHKARSSLPMTLQPRIDVVSGQNYKTFSGEHWRTEKAPDTVVKVLNAAGIWEPKFVLEVGAESVCVVMLVKLVEDPVYRCPILQLTEAEFESFEFPHPTLITQDLFVIEGTQGPATYKGFRWVGHISGFIEIWKRDPISGNAIRTSGPFYHLNRPDTSRVYFWLSDFMDVPAEHNHEIAFDWGILHQNLASYIRELAVDRCSETLTQHMDDATMEDGDYHPASQAGLFRRSLVMLKLWAFELERGMGTLLPAVGINSSSPMMISASYSPQSAQAPWVYMVAFRASRYAAGSETNGGEKHRVRKPADTAAVVSYSLPPGPVALEFIPSTRPIGVLWIRSSEEVEDSGTAGGEHLAICSSRLDSCTLDQFEKGQAGNVVRE
ncbi:hypothetical protein HOY80DRAFT_1035636 [Tuber brumale]|nr:hypothetical protein HOY80DRAFT_1035636 [Tuber brumale]